MSSEKMKYFATPKKYRKLKLNKLYHKNENNL